MLIRHIDVSQAFEAANRIRSMRPRVNAENMPATFSLHVEDEHEKNAQGVKIELKDVVFKYPTRDAPVLKNLSMTVGKAKIVCYIGADIHQIESGQFAAIVGPSGIVATYNSSIRQFTDLYRRLWKNKHYLITREVWQ